MKTNFKKIKTPKNLFMTFIAGRTVVAGKEGEETPSASASMYKDIASKITGNYTGRGESPAGNSFVNQTIKISRMGDTRVKIEPIGHNDIAAFEINIIQINTVITQDDNEANDFEVKIGTSPHSLEFETYIPDQKFNGTKQ